MKIFHAIFTPLLESQSEKPFNFNYLDGRGGETRTHDPQLGKFTEVNPLTENAIYGTI